ncbi:hypothetical protein Aph01nite_62580 [Acrocarpospora phusangensis]|uniref:ATP/GTP-binding protein n=1 Tax=Acrocarpospora phusangensis TaxID=1070424 RepID=A0A919URW2_9ACTN|nr:FxSxx-COOH system tetratricopeptide repeat protein [Acrocarpospora phusangensis]GIH27948.1 hypothetical protein Aph01nite_62580 [Acrocarpospora phusangensis]
MGDHDGQIVTFYSFNGGTGRTMSLANTAWILASNGKRVLVVDWDLDSPGLNRFFQPFVDPEEVEYADGVSEMLADYARDVIRNSDPLPQFLSAQLAKLSVPVRINWDHFPGAGYLDLMSAGRQNRAYTSQVSNYQWDEFYSDWSGGQFLKALREHWKSAYDYVLIDSRTGLSDLSEICTVDLPDTIVVCFTLSNQSIEGAAQRANVIDDRFTRIRDIRILPVPMRVEENEKEKADIGRAFAQSRFSRFPRGANPQEVRNYWGSVQIPYRPFYAFEEILAPFGDPPGQQYSMLSAFERLTAEITHQEITSLPPMKEELRLRYRRQFVRHPVTHSTSVAISYVPEDRLWAEWTKVVLQNANMQVELLNIERLADDEIGVAMRAVDHTVAMVSPAYLRSQNAQHVVDLGRDLDPTGTKRFFTSIRISDVAIRKGHTEHAVVDIFRISEAQAESTLLDLFGRNNLLLSSGPRHSSLPRYPDKAPDVWEVPTRNASFTGRADLLETIRDELTGNSAGRPLALYGLGGVGKTQVALEYAHRFKSDYDLICWVPAEQVDAIASTMGDLVQHMDAQSLDNSLEPAQRVREALRKGDTFKRWLLIFDNAREAEEIERYIPSDSGHVIITSRDPSWNQLARPLEVAVFQRRESVAHLMRRAGESNITTADAELLADALGDLPIAIEQAGAWLRETGAKTADYVDQLKGRGLVVLDLNPPRNYPTSVAATWQVAYELLRERSPASARLLELLSFFAAEPVNLDLVNSAAMRRCLLPYDEALQEPVVMGRVIRELGRLALAKVNPSQNSIEVHRLVQAVVRETMDSQLQNDTIHEVHRVLVAARPSGAQTDSPGSRAAFNMIWPHLCPSQACGCDEAETRQLLIDRVRYLWQQGEYEVSLELARSVKKNWDETLGVDDRQTLHLQSQMANVLRSQGHYRDARDLDTVLLEKQRGLVGNSHPHTLATAAGLAADIRAMGDIAVALKMEMDTYNLWKENYGENNAKTLDAANNLAVGYRHMGDYKSAYEIDLDTLGRRRNVLENSHPNILSSITSLARDVRELGDFRRAVKLLRDGVAEYEGTLTLDDPFFLRASKSLAAALRVAGEYAEAYKEIQKTYQHLEGRVSKSSPDWLSCTLELACTMATNRRIKEAVRQCEQVMRLYTTTLGAEHPSTLTATNNLAIYLAAGGDVGGALRIADRALQAFRHNLPENHPFTLTCAVNVGALLVRQEQPAQARELLAQTLEAIKQTLSEDHPDHLICASNLAIATEQAGASKVAQNLRQDLLSPAAAVFGDSHPDYLAIRDGGLCSRPLEPHQW